MIEMFGKIGGTRKRKIERGVKDEKKQMQVHKHKKENRGDRGDITPCEICQRCSTIQHKTQTITSRPSMGSGSHPDHPCLMSPRGSAEAQGER